MKTFFKAVTLAATLIFVPYTTAVQAAQKIAVVYPSKIMQESPQRNKIIKKLEDEFKGRYQALQLLESEIKKLEKAVQRDAELLGKDKVTAMKREIEVKVSEYKLKRKAFEEDNRRRQGEEQQEALMVLREVINDIAAQDDYDIILNGEQIVFSKPALDISERVIKEISKK
ncbi:outer membrane chaperone Skp (OmpH) [Psychromonas ingrahamii 37]|uniref:Outer membrane chaperone Skp (OmpH) n=1 Tax=Psychromonas ingrahamii (strain DSM 17664 / CCUG 51855 / 37) TaxID=357804 RepID=A1SYV4_PSYIN|nr:OmpH family outer membrane protein [Psychromonas ingrahamii]ABM04669.1 outer membrane chaperone Skp (OmpH) [Psychromonas ingrahamii 37]